MTTFTKNNIGIIAGSLRKESFSGQIARAIVEMAPEGYTFEPISIDNLPVYNQDFDDGNRAPASYNTFRKTVKQLDGIIFITPEHNRSIPAALKNALDIASWPYGENQWDGKPGAVFSCSPGDISGFGAHHHLRQSLVYLNVLVMQQPEVYLAKVDKLLDGKGNIKDDAVQKFLNEAVDAYIDWFERNKAA